MTGRRQPRSLLDTCHHYLYQTKVSLFQLEGALIPSQFARYLGAFSDGSLRPLYDNRRKDREYFSRAQSVRRSYRALLDKVNLSGAEFSLALERAARDLHSLRLDVSEPDDQADLYDAERTCRRVMRQLFPVEITEN